MLINNKQRDRRDEIKVNVQGTDIDSMNSIKLLGVTIDHKVNFSVHINITCKKANQMIGVLMRLIIIIIMFICSSRLTLLATV